MKRQVYYYSQLMTTKYNFLIKLILKKVSNNKFVY